MSPNVTVRIDAKDTIRYLKEIRKSIPQAGLSASRKSAYKIRDRARSNLRKGKYNSPYQGQHGSRRHGKLAEATKVKKTKGGYKVFNALPYAAAVELGSRESTTNYPRWVRIGPGARNGRNGWVFMKKHKGSRGIRFMERALNSSRGDINKIINKEVNKALAK